MRVSLPLYKSQAAPSSTPGTFNADSKSIRVPSARQLVYLVASVAFVKYGGGFGRQRAASREDGE